MKNFQALEQVRNLGLTRIIAGQERYKILDFGCGKNEYLIGFLEEKGFYVDGIDPEIKKPTKNRIKTEVISRSPNNGCIPVENQIYDLVLSHQNFSFNETMTGLRNTQFIKCHTDGNYDEEIIKREILAKNGLSELIRVCKPTGAVVIYPSLDLIEGFFGKELIERGLRSQIVTVPEVDDGDTEIICQECNSSCYEICKSIQARTILFWEGVDRNLLDRLT